MAHAIFYGVRKCFGRARSAALPASVLLASILRFTDCTPSDTSGTGGTSQTGAVAGSAGSTAGTGAAGNAGIGGSAGSFDAGTSGTGGTAEDAGTNTDGDAGANAGGNAGAGGTSNGAAGVHWVGRVDARNPNAVVFAWQGAGFIATVSGSAISVELQTTGTSTVFFQPVIDGTAGTRFEVPSGGVRTITLASGLSNRDHQVELYRDTEGAFGQSTFLGFASGQLKAPPATSGRAIEVVGDSISAGYGNLGTELHPGWVANPACDGTVANSSWYRTYAAVAGHALNAEVSTIAHSGWGMYRDWTGDTTHVLSAIYDDTVGVTPTPVWSFSVEPSAVVINLGTNDWKVGDPGTAYETAYLKFIAHVREHYPHAWVFLTIGSMLDQTQLNQVDTRLAAVVRARNALGDHRVSSLDFGPQNLGPDGSIPSGCGWHPNVTEDARMAGMLEAELRSKLGW